MWEVTASRCERACFASDPQEASGDTRQPLRKTYSMSSQNNHAGGFSVKGAITKRFLSHCPRQCASVAACDRAGKKKHLEGRDLVV